MDELLDELFFHAMEHDRRCHEENLRAQKAAEPAYRRLEQAMGKEADEIWIVATQAGSAEVTPAFRAGLRLGLRLMAICLEELC